MLSDILSGFSKSNPNVKIKILIDSATNLNNYLIEHKIDVLIDYLPHINYSEKFNLEVKSLWQYKTCFACSKSFYEEIKDQIHSLSDLEKFKLVISGSSRRRQMLDNVLQKNNITLIPYHLMPDSKLMADFIKKMI